MSIPTVPLGSQGLRVSRQGLGCMGMSAFYGSDDEKESIATLERAIDLGVTFWDTAQMYGWGANEELLGRVLTGRRDAAGTGFPHRPVHLAGRLRGR
jgi:aryl-alcohol dehydrogenase-like predicted oxidoreductase